MRTILLSIVFLIFFIISIPLFVIEFIIGLFSKKLRAKIAQFIISSGCRVVLKVAGTKLKAIGMDRVPKDRGVVYIFNHRSYFDPIICYATAPTLAGFIAMDSLKNVPFINVWMIFLRCLFLDRSSLRKGLKVIKEGVKLINEGHSIFIAPEGRRNFEGVFDMLPFKEGSFKLAKKSKCPIIPVSINNADRIFEKQFPWIKSTDVVIEYGEPIYIDNLEEGEKAYLGKYVQNIIWNMLKKNHKVT